jgi:serine O-acetyltransferase
MPVDRSGESSSGDCEPTISLWEHIREDYETHGRDSSLPGFRALAVYRLGAWGRLQSPGIAKFMHYLWLLLHRRIRNRYGIEIPATAALGRRILLAHYGAICIHDFARIGDDCLIRHGVTIGALAGGAGAPILEEGVEVGTGVVIAGPITIGARARIGPNAVVTRNVPVGAVVFASESRTIFTRGPESEGRESAPSERRDAQ